MVGSSLASALKSCHFLSFVELGKQSTNGRYSGIQQCSLRGVETRLSSSPILIAVTGSAACPCTPRIQCDEESHHNERWWGSFWCHHFKLDGEEYWCSWLTWSHCIVYEYHADFEENSRFATCQFASIWNKIQMVHLSSWVIIYTHMHIHPKNKYIVSERSAQQQVTQIYIPTSASL